MGIFFLIVGVGVLAWGWFMHLRVQAAGRHAQVWPTAPGHVTGSEVIKVAVGQGYMLTPAITYSFEAAGQPVQSRGLRIGAPPMFNTPAKAQALVDKYPVGSQVTVHYNPASPVNAALELKVEEGISILMTYAFGATFLAAGVLVALVLHQ